MSRKGHGKGSTEDPLKELADRLRSKGGVEWRQAILADQRVEYIRGKDFATYFKSNESQMLTWVSRGLKLDDQIKTLAELMMRRRLFVKADRMFKKPKPGKKRPAKWPKKLLPLYADQTFQEEFFYAWQYDRPSSPWLFVLSVLLVVVVLLFCLFPLAPQPIKLAVVYCSMALLILIFTILTVRTIIAAVSWVALGRSLWLFPYLLSELESAAKRQPGVPAVLGETRSASQDKGLDEAFWPVFQLEEMSKEKEGLLQSAMRLGFGLSLVALSLALYHHAPDKGAALGGAKDAHDAILDMLNLRGKGPSLTYEAPNAAAAGGEEAKKAPRGDKEL